MTRNQQRLLVEALQTSHRTTNQHKSDFVKLSAQGYVERETVSILGIECQRVQLTDKGRAKAQELTASLKT